ncbi:TonB-dependent receptor, partial [bacterium]|nr:TonB-dependent receptor [bacterium]
MIFYRAFFWQQVQTKVAFEHKYQRGKINLTSRLSYDEYEVSDGTQYKFTTFVNYIYAHSQSVKWEELFEIEIDQDSKLVAGFSIEKSEVFPKHNRPTPWSGGSYISYPMPDVGVIYPVDGPVQVAGKTITYGAFNYTDYGVFAEYTKQLSHKLQGNIGVRYDYNSDYANTLNPRLGLVYEADDKTNLKLLYGTAYIKPSKFWAYESWNGGSNGKGGQTYYVQNPDLSAEEIDSYQFNIERQVNHQLKVTLNTFKNEIDNLIRSFWSDYGINTFGYNINSGTPSSKGYELLFDLTPHNMSYGYFYYSYVNAKTNNAASSNQDTNKVADHKVHVGWTWKWSENSLSLRSRYYSSTPYISRTSTDLQYMKSRTIVDLTFRKDLDERKAIYLSVNNLLDKKYFGPSPFGEGGGALEDTAV